MADVVGPTRRDLATTSANAGGAASRKTHYELESRDAPIPANRHKTSTPRPPRHRSGGGDYTLMTTRDSGARQPTQWLAPKVARVAPRPAAATQMKVTSMTSVQGEPTAVTPSAPVGTEQLVRSHPSCVRQLPCSGRAAAGEFSRGTLPYIVLSVVIGSPPLQLH